MRFLVNNTRGRTMRSIRRHGKAVSRSAWKRSGFTRNAPRKRTRRKLTGAALAAHLKKIHRSRRPKRHTSRTGTARRVARHAASSRRGTMKRRKHSARRARRSTRRRSRRYASNPVVRHRRRGSRRRFARNPSSVRGLVGFAVQGLKDAAGVVVGKAAARAIPQMVGLNQGGVAGYAIQGLAAIAAGFAASKFLGANVGRMVLAGGLAAPLETAVKALNIPIVSGALGAYPLAAYPLSGIADGTGIGQNELAALGSGMGMDGDELMM